MTETSLAFTPQCCWCGVTTALLVDDGGSAERTGVSQLPDAPLPETDQVEEVVAGRDDGLRTLHVEVADAADVAVLDQL